VLSGINLGLNIGNGLWHSGTLAAAKQAALLDLRGIAVSTATLGKAPDFERIAPCVEQVLELLLPREDLRLVNVNVPPDPLGIRWTRQSVRTYDGRIVPAQDPMGRQIYWFTVEPIQAVEEGTDRWAVQEGFVSMTPLRLDLTDEAQLEALGKGHERRHASAVPRG